MTNDDIVNLDSFNDIDIIDKLDIADTVIGDSITIIEHKGRILTSKEIKIAEDKEEGDIMKTLYFIQVQHKGVEKEFRLNPKNLLFLKKVCKGNPKKLVGQTFNIMHNGEGNYKHIILTGV